MKLLYMASALVLGFLVQAPAAEANYKLTVCLSGIKFTCQTGINQKKFKNEREKALWLRNCISLGENQCRTRLGVKKVIAPGHRGTTTTRHPSPRHHGHRGTSYRQPTAAHCRTTCLAQAREQQKSGVVKGRGAARTWYGHCYKRCRAGKVQVTHTRPTHNTHARPSHNAHARPTHNTHARPVHNTHGSSTKADCNRTCLAEAQAHVKSGHLKSRSAGRTWYGHCYKRCRKGGGVARPAHPHTTNTTNTHQAQPSKKDRRSCSSSCRSQASVKMKTGEIKGMSAARAWVKVCFQQCMR